jgi:ribose 5-phosphate isomerase B
MKKVALGSDHGGIELKNEIKKHLEAKGVEVVDFGTHSTDSVDYPDYAKLVGNAVVNGEADCGILICGTGIGISIAANKISGVRAALCHNVWTTRLTREHNDANVLCMGGRVIGLGIALEMVDVFLATEFEGGRHAIRVGKIEG